MITKTLARPVSLISPLKTTTSCFNKNAEILKKINRNDLDPKKYGVTFNQDNGLCNYTSDFCDRVGLDYTVKNSIPDCTEDTGQKVAEAIVGKTITRGFKRAFGIPSYEKIHSGDCCTLGFTCNGCPGNSEFEWVWNCAGSRKCK